MLFEFELDSDKKEEEVKPFESGLKEAVDWYWKNLAP